MVDWLFQSCKPTKTGQQVALRCAFGVAILLAMPLVGQSPNPFPSSSGDRLERNYPDALGPGSQDANSPDQKRIRILNSERQKALVSDTERLLKLAKELNDEMAQNEAEAMNDSELRKVSEIGKLARSVKEKMSFTVGGYPSFISPLTTTPRVQ